MREVARLAPLSNPVGQILLCLHLRIEDGMSGEPECLAEIERADGAGRSHRLGRDLRLQDAVRVDDAPRVAISGAWISVRIAAMRATFSLILSAADRTGTHWPPGAQPSSAAWANRRHNSAASGAKVSTGGST